MNRAILIGLGWLCLSVSLVGTTASADSRAAYERLAWVKKTARVLRGGNALPQGTDLNALAALSDDALVDKFLADPLYGDFALDFGLYFLGGKLDRLRDETGAFVPRLFDWPSAIHAAQEAVGGRDFLQLLILNQPLYLGPLADPMPSNQGPPPNISAAARRAAVLRGIGSRVGALIAYLGENPATPFTKFCDFYITTFAERNLVSAGLPTAMRTWAESENAWHGPLELACQFPSELSNLVDPVRELKKIQTRYAEAAAALASFEPSTYKVEDVRDVKAFAMQIDGQTVRANGMAFPLALTMVNSSTNYDRKRAAYVLSRYFCDDLTPIGAEAPPEHAGNQHASDANCFSCHYKLDPMAGFFRDRGYRFQDFSKIDFIRFDDNAKASSVKYMKSWLGGPASNGGWNVGYVRSVQYLNRNDYGTTLADLDAILRRAPEPRRCVIKRLSQFLIGENQAIDGDYLDAVAAEFVTGAEQDSSTALKRAVKRLVTSDAFRRHDLDPKQCYDHLQGFDPASSPPCLVAHTFRTSCAGCHGSESPRARLDLTKWVLLPDGTRNFVHLDGQGHQRDTRTTMTAIVERLSATDPVKQMPLGKFLGHQDRELLYLWATDELAKAGGLAR